MPRDPGNHGDERRLIDVTEVQVLGTSQIVQLVAKDPVPSGREKMKKELRDRQRKHDGRTGQKTMDRRRPGPRKVNYPFHSSRVRLAANATLPLVGALADGDGRLRFSRSI